MKTKYIIKFAILTFILSYFLIDVWLPFAGKYQPSNPLFWFWVVSPLGIWEFIISGYNVSFDVLNWIYSKVKKLDSKYVPEKHQV